MVLKYYLAVKGNVVDDDGDGDSDGDDDDDNDDRGCCRVMLWDAEWWVGVVRKEISRRDDG